MSEPGRSRWHLMRGPVLVWLGLVALIALTTFFGYLPLHRVNAAINFPIAGIMVALVAVFLMRLDKAPGVLWLAALTGLVFLFNLFLLTFGDYFNR